MVQVSVIIVNYNTFELTNKCIQSVFDNTKDLNFEIILIDNASTDENPDKFKQHFPDIKLIVNPENIGFSRGNNLGINIANGHYIVLLNSDTELVNNAIKITYDKINKDSSIAAISSKLVFPNGKIQHCCQKFPSLFLDIIEKCRIHKLFSKKTREQLFFGSYFDHQIYAEPDWIWGTFFLFNKKIIEALPGEKLNDEYFMYMEDMQWCFDFRKNGYKIAYEPQAVVLHHMGGSSADKIMLMKENYNKFLKKNYSSLDYIFLKK